MSPLPHYTYVPGRTPHPISSPDGHMRGHKPPVVGDLTLWWNGDAFRTGVHLFNHGYYWEAHEAWEAVWKALPRNSADWHLVQGLIKLAAGGVKCLEANAGGARRHFRRAQQLLLLGQSSRAPLQQTALHACLERLVVSPPVLGAASNGQPRPLLPPIGGFEQPTDEVV